MVLGLISWAGSLNYSDATCDPILKVAHNSDIFFNRAGSMFSSVTISGYASAATESFINRL